MRDDPGTLRTLLAGPEPLVAPLALDPLSARAAAAAGFRALYVGGGALGYRTTFSEATLGLQELLDVGVAIRAACDLPLILDGTCGWGDPMHLGRTIAATETAGFAAIEIEDQILPKRAHHHIDIEHLIPQDLMVQKIQAAVAARSNPDFVIIARTNACRTDGLDEAVRRVRAYRDAGADLLLVITRSPQQLLEVGQATGGPLVCMPAAGIPSLPAGLDELGRLGYRLVVDAMTPLLAATKALRLAYQAIAAGRPDPTFGGSYRDEVDRIHELIGLDAMLDIERRTVETATVGAAVEAAVKVDELAAVDS